MTVPQPEGLNSVLWEAGRPDLSEPLFSAVEWDNNLSHVGMEPFRCQPQQPLSGPLLPSLLVPGIISPLKQVSGPDLTAHKPPAPTLGPESVSVCMQFREGEDFGQRLLSKVKCEDMSNLG